MFICEIWLFDWYFPQFCKSDMSKYGYLEVFQRIPSTLSKRESTVFGRTHGAPYRCYGYIPLRFGGGGGGGGGEHR